MTEGKFWFPFNGPSELLLFIITVYTFLSLVSKLTEALKDRTCVELFINNKCGMVISDCKSFIIIVIYSQLLSGVSVEIFG